jgi:3-hydroxyisobutyrate dehydrogenase-like beta-hydroxyacid dehydrogenase
MKLVVNLLLGVEMQAIAEAVSLGEHLQLNRDVLLDVLSKTAVIPPAFVGKFQKIKNNDYSPEFPLRLMSKDMDLVIETAGSAGANLPAAGVASLYLPPAAPQMAIWTWQLLSPMSSITKVRKKRVSAYELLT